MCACVRKSKSAEAPDYCRVCWPLEWLEQQERFDINSHMTELPDLNYLFGVFVNSNYAIMLVLYKETFIIMNI